MRRPGIGNRGSGADLTPPTPLSDAERGALIRAAESPPLRVGEGGWGGEVSPLTHWDALSDATHRFEDDDASESPQLDAELLLRQVLGIERVQLFMRYDRPLAPDAVGQFEALVDRRLAGEPMAYILGSRWFRNIELFVDERVLIPRPETERFVEYALAWLRSHPGPRRVVDVGTGSGAIALALADELGKRRPDVQIIATDISSAALDVAAINRDRLNMTDRVELVESDLLTGFAEPFDIILANLPYLRPDQRHPSTRREPEVALFGGPDGFDLHRRLLRQSATLLTPDGLWVGEIDPAQAEIAIAFASEATGRAARAEVDYAGDARYLLIR
ncbi:MAG TPA: peptide chain release factor N(5)-glutamine methyltransferase [Thermomicrobiales bacterium]|nr:peptide chain release factor N(5)-glutamine methyltransferase [Thermomicrobiales bacterium]